MIRLLPSAVEGRHIRSESSYMCYFSQRIFWVHKTSLTPPTFYGSACTKPEK